MLRARAPGSLRHRAVGPGLPTSRRLTGHQPRSQGPAVISVGPAHALGTAPGAQKPESHRPTEPLQGGSLRGEDPALHSALWLYLQGQNEERI